jgi:Flp pilus assembly pilin Flp
MNDAPREGGLHPRARSYGDSVSNDIRHKVGRILVVLAREDGQTFFEYALVGALVAVAFVTALGILEGMLQGTFFSR